MDLVMMDSSSSRMSASLVTLLVKPVMEEVRTDVSAVEKVYSYPTDSAFVSLVTLRTISEDAVRVKTQDVMRAKVQA
jgi:hypothetical protein